MKYPEFYDIIISEGGDFQKEMPLVDSIIAEDGKLQLYYDLEEHSREMLQAGLTKKEDAA